MRGFEKKLFISLNIVFALANMVDPDQMPHLGLQCLPKSIVYKLLIMSAKNLVVLHVLTLLELKPIK